MPASSRRWAQRCNSPPFSRAGGNHCPILAMFWLKPDLSSNLGQGIALGELGPQARRRRGVPCACGPLSCPPLPTRAGRRVRQEGGSQ